VGVRICAQSGANREKAARAVGREQYAAGAAE